jgi:hypothetical protein
LKRLPSSCKGSGKFIPLQRSAAAVSTWRGICVGSLVIVDAEKAERGSVEPKNENCGVMPPKQ